MNGDTFEMRKALIAADITNEMEFAEAGGALMWIDEERDPDASIRDYRKFEARLYHRTSPGESWQMRPFTGTDRCSAAMDWAEEQHPEGAQWVAGFFSHAWQTWAAHKRVMALVGRPVDVREGPRWVD